MHMKYLFCMVLVFSLYAFQQPDSKDVSKNPAFSSMLENYFNQRMAMFPMEATANGDNRFNDKLYPDFTDSYREKIKHFYSTYKDSLQTFDRDKLDINDHISYDIFKREMDMGIEGLGLHAEYLPFNQFYALPLDLGTMGSGDGNQPFKTVQDYDNWLARISAFPAWADSSIDYFKKGMAANFVLPKTLVVKMIPQMQAMDTKDAAQSLFYGPIKKLPATFSDADKKRLTDSYVKIINIGIVPTYKKLATFLQTEYLPKSRTSTGFDSLPVGDKYYNYLVRYWTTTNNTPDEIYNTGLAEVKRIRGIMDSVKNSVGFKGTLDSFFNFMRTDKKFMPYKKPEEILAAFHAIQDKSAPYLKNMFGRVPKSKFEIRQTEAFRAASASAEYYPGAPDGSRPGIFYIPILDATKFNTTSGMENLFLHEAIPGHHYQGSLTMEDTSLPTFRRFLWYGAYGEGWALYCESLGKELGLYTDPYQYMGALGDEIHRAIRLVVDVGMHAKGMTREAAIKYMTDNEAISTEGATAEIERYMAIPGQALSYKTGSMKIQALRKKYTDELGAKFKLSDFHDEFLRYGCMPLDVIEAVMDRWAAKQK